MPTGRPVQIIRGDVECGFDGRSVAWHFPSESSDEQWAHSDGDVLSPLYLQGLSGAKSGRPCIFELLPKSLF